MKNIDALNDVRRKINEVMTKNEKRIVVGWRPGLEQERKEGEVWEDVDGRKWTIKNGIRQTVTKLDGFKTPWWCPKCDKVMNHRLDDKFWRIRGHCLDCNIKEEMEIRKQGPEAWQAYERKIMRANYKARLQDDIATLKDIQQAVSAPEFIHADEEAKRILMVERWNVDIDQVKADIQKDIDVLEAKLKEVEEDMANEKTS